MAKALAVALISLAALLGAAKHHLPDSTGWWGRGTTTTTDRPASALQCFEARAWTEPGPTGTTLWHPPCWIKYPELYRVAIDVSGARVMALAGEDYNGRVTAIRTDPDGYAICAGTPLAAGDNLRRIQKAKREQDAAARAAAEVIAP